METRQIHTKFGIHLCFGDNSQLKWGKTYKIGTYLLVTLSSECTISAGCGCGGCCCFVFSLLRPLFVLSTFAGSGCTVTGIAGLDSIVGCCCGCGCCCCCSFTADGAVCFTLATIFADVSGWGAALLPLFDCEVTLWLGAECLDFGLCFCCESEIIKIRFAFNWNSINDKWNWMISN